MKKKHNNFEKIQEIIFPKKNLKNNNLKKNKFKKL